MTSICANTTHRLVLRLRKARKLSVLKYCRPILKVLSRLLKTTIMESFQTIFSSTGTEWETQ